MQKRLNPALKKTVTPKVVKVALPKDGIVQVKVPAGVVPVVATDKGVVEIVPVAKKKTWWQSVFG